MGAVPAPSTGGRPIDAIFDLLVVSRWVHLSSMVVVFGGAVFWIYAARGVAPDALPCSRRQTCRLIAAGAPLAALSGIIWLLATIANMTGDVAGIVDLETLHAFFFETPFGPLTVGRLVLLAGLVGCALMPLDVNRRFVLLTTISALLLVSQAWLGHAAEGGQTIYGSAMIFAYAVHVLAGAAWVGGLPPLLLALLEQRTQADPSVSALRILLPFSAMAVAAVGLIVLSGIANAGFRVGGAFMQLAATGYGNVLLAKIAIVSTMLALAAYNRFVVMPRMRAQARLLRRLRTGIAVEAALGVLVLGAAAVLGITPPPQ